MRGFIYKITNKVNGKSYIGLTRNTVEFRWRQYIHATDNYALHLAIRKHGIDNFSVETLEECDASKLDEREIYYIYYYNTFLNGYNMTKGGNSIPKSTSRVYINVDDKFSEIKQLYLSGYSCSKIGSLFNVNRKIIAYVLKNMGVKVRSNQKFKVNKLELLEIIDRYNSGESLNSISKFYEVSIHTISRLLENNNIIIRKPLLYDEERARIIINKYLDPNYKISLIEKEDKVSYSKILEILDYYNIPKRENKSKKLLNNSDIEQEIIKLYLDGKSSLLIAKIYNVSTYPILRILKEHNIPRRQHNFPKSVQTLSHSEG